MKMQYPEDYKSYACLSWLVMACRELPRSTNLGESYIANAAHLSPTTPVRPVVPRRHRLSLYLAAYSCSAMSLMMDWAQGA